MHSAREARKETARELPYVEAELNYLVPPDGPLWNYTYEPPAGQPRTNASYEARRVAIHDLRPIADELSLDRQGFALIAQESAVGDFYDEDELRRVYYPETERLVAKATGARRVVVFDHTIRRRHPGASDRTAGLPRQPVTRIHNDYTLKSGPQRVRDLMGAEATALLGRRFAVINVWRPIRGPLHDAPLAVCDAATIEGDDFVPVEQRYRDRTGEISYVIYDPAHRWYYAPAMRAAEALLIKCYDSATDGRARFVAHSAFEDPTMPADALPRESIELRTLVFDPV